MKAKAQEARAAVIQAEKEVPQAISEALRNGNIGVMDYYRMKNIQSDTDMRDAISKPRDEGHSSSSEDTTDENE
jgi:uncharacterized protein YqfA (UPF0365 family)